MHSPRRHRAPRPLRVILAGIALAIFMAPIGVLVVFTQPVGASTSVLTEDDPGGSDTGGGGGEAPAPEPAASDGPAAPSGEASVDPGESGAGDPADAPSDVASDEPTDVASDEPTDAASDDPTDELTNDPSDEASDEASDGPEEEPTGVDASSAGAGGASASSMPTAPGETPAMGASQVQVRLAGGIGQVAAGMGVQAAGSGVQPGSSIAIWFFSSPQLLSSGFASPDGSFDLSALLPASVSPGEHTILVKGTDSQGQPFEQGTGVTVAADGTIAGITEGVSTADLAVPSLPSNPKSPQYPQVRALDNPTAVVATAAAAIAVVAVAGATAGTSSRGATGGASTGPSGGDLNTSMYWRADREADEDVSHNRGWRTRFTARGDTWGDRSWLHRSPGSSFVDEASYVATKRVAPVSPLLARVLADGAPLRAITGSASLLLPLVALGLGVSAGISQDGVAQPPVLALLIPLMIIGVLDSLAGLVGVAAFSAMVLALGGLVDASSVRTLIGILMLVIGPSLVAGSFRELRRPVTSGFSAVWEHLIDFVTVPLLGAWITLNVASAFPALGGAEFPIAEQGAVLALVVLVALLVKVALETLAGRAFPERLASIVPGEDSAPGAAQKVTSGLLRAAMFLFISAAFVGNVWQLWVAGALFVIPLLLEPLAERRFRNAPTLWQVLPEGLLYFVLLLAALVGLGAMLGGSLGSGVEYAQTAFLVFLIPDFVMAVLWLFGREPKAGDVRWYMRPSLTWLYRVGGVVVLAAAIWLAAPR